MISLRRRALSVLCAVTLATSMVPTQAFAETLTGGLSIEQIATLPEGEYGDSILIREESASTAQTSALVLDGLALLTLDENQNAALRDGRYEKWIDRIDIPEYARAFYGVLEEASDNDGVDDFLIGDNYFKGTVESAGSFVAGNGSGAIVVGSQTCASLSEMERKTQEMSAYALAAAAAFDRDHPEVFWLGNSYCTSRSYSYNPATEAGTLVVTFAISGDLAEEGGKKFDIRSAPYASETLVRDGIKLRDESIAKIVEGCPAAGTIVEKLEYLNDTLTHNNEYNTKLKELENSGEYPQAWECISALAGRDGEEGPVCEGYSRAFKVLCEKIGIPCVLVDGLGISSTSSGPHMWNNVKVEDFWYAIDVTWNDPTGGKPGNESGFESRDYFLVGAQTEVKNVCFSDSHQVRNSVFKGGTTFVNGPLLNWSRYDSESAKACSNGVHKFGTYKYNNDASCENNGTETSNCSYCGESQIKEKANSALGHALGAYVYNNDAKVGVDGTETATCLRCGAKNTRTKAGSALKADTSNLGTTQPTTPTTKPSTPATPTVPSTPTTKPSTSTGSSATTAAPVLAKGQTVSVGGSSYTVTGAPTVTYAGPSNKKAASVTVPATVAISGRTYKVTAIASKAFAGNKYLKSIKIGANVAAIPASAFKGCAKLTSVSFGNGITSLGKNAFYGCKALKSVTLGTKVATIGDGAFQNCTKLTKVTVKSKSLKSVGKSAFAGCKKLKAITLKTTKLKSVGKNALKGTAKKLTVKVPKAKVRVYQKLFKSKGSKAVVVKK